MGFVRLEQRHHGGKLLGVSLSTNVFSRSSVGTNVLDAWGLDLPAKVAVHFDNDTARMALVQDDNGIVLNIMPPSVSGGIRLRPYLLQVGCAEWKGTKAVPWEIVDLDGLGRALVLDLSELLPDRAQQCFVRQCLLPKKRPRKD